MKKLQLLLIPLLMLSCQRYSSDHLAQRRADENYYARNAYLEEEARLAAMDSNDSFHSKHGQKLTIDIESHHLPVGWEKLPYETVDQWMERIIVILERNHFHIQELKEDLGVVSDKETTLVAKLHELIKRNEEMREMISDYGIVEETNENHSVSAATTATQHLPPADFKLHLVRKGETLFSIAMSHYQVSERTRDLILWNQGWIRSPEELLAGIALVLFPEGAEDTSQQVVDLYIENMERHQ